MFLLLDQFNSVFTSPNTNMIVHDPVSFFSCQLNPDKCLTDIEITEQIIIDSIQELSSTSAAGPDDVPSSLLLKCAVFERIIRKQVVAFMNRQGHMNNTQHGFRSSRSCLSALLDVFDDLMHMLSSDTTSFLTSMFKTALNKNIIPHTWKLAIIVPIPKPNKDTDRGTSYRSISLLSVIAKTLEKSPLLYITANIPNTPMQHGYKTQHEGGGEKQYLF